MGAAGPTIAIRNAGRALFKKYAQEIPTIPAPTTAISTLRLCIPILLRVEPDARNGRSCRPRFAAGAAKVGDVTCSALHAQFPQGMALRRLQCFLRLHDVIAQQPDGLLDLAVTTQLEQLIVFALGAFLACRSGDQRPREA